MTPDRMIGAYCFCPVCLFDSLSACVSLTFAIPCEPVTDRESILGLHTHLMMPF